MFDFALREQFETVEAAEQYFLGEVKGRLKLGWNVGTHDTFYIYERDDWIIVMKWDEVLDLDYEFKRLTQNVHTLQ